MKVYKTNRLYYGKWLYKIETVAPGANLIKYWGFSKMQEFCNSKTTHKYTRSVNNINKDEMLKYLAAIEPFINKDLQTRAEWNTLNFFINDKNLYIKLKKALHNWVVSVTEPDNDTDITSLKSKNSIILCNELPYDRYQYKIYIRTTMPAHQRASFYSWASNYKDEIHFSQGTKKWLTEGLPYFQSPFLYINNRNQLLLVSMHLGHWVRNTHEFVRRNTLKTVK